MSVAASPPPGSGPAAAASRPEAAGEACPLCGAPLHPAQEWCLQCGAAARTRLAASPNWKGLLATLAVLVALSLGVLAAALVKLAGESGSSAAATTRTVVSSAAALAPSTGSAAAGGALAGGRAATPATPPVHTSTRVPGSAAVPRTGGSASRGTTLGGIQARVEERLRKAGLLGPKGVK